MTAFEAQKMGMEWDISHPTLLTSSSHSGPSTSLNWKEVDKPEVSRTNDEEDKPEVSPTALAFPYYSPTSYSPTRDARSKEKRVFVVPWHSSRREERRRCGEVALEYYNKKNGTSYELVSSLLCKHFSGDSKHEIWVHFNFAAKQNVEGDYSRRIFFAEFLEYHKSPMKEKTWTIAACLMLEKGSVTHGCNLCSNVLHPNHPPNGFLKGHNKPLPTLPLDLPTLLIYGRETHSGSSGTFNFVSDEEWSDELRRRVKIALKYYNEKNQGHNVGWILDAYNFTAKPHNGGIDGESSSKLFFTEILGVVIHWTDNAENVIWTASACHILLDGKTTDGCRFCSNIIHPTHGFSQGITRAQTNKYPPGHTISCALSYAEKQDRRAEFALEKYNRENGTNYELLDVIIHSSFVSKGTWSHYNFVAKQDVDGKYTRNIFFAEILVIHCHPTENLIVTACLILDDKNTAGCSMCSDVIHPTYGFLKGLDELKGLYPTTSPSRETDRYSSTNTSPFVFTSDEAWFHELGRRANIALQCYNKENGTDYELVDVFKNKGIFWDGFWMHINFTAKPPKGDIEEKKLFFAEIRGVYDTPGAVTWTWKSTACHILDGRTTDGCMFCSGIIHPTHGFSQGIARAKINKCDITVPCTLPSTEKRCRRAEIAIEYYNKINSTNYELLYVILSNGFSSDGTWYHCNFEAKQDEDGKYCRRSFFAEILVDSYNPMWETLTVTACHILEDGKITASCGLCSDVIHPHQGFLKGHHEYEA